MKEQSELTDPPPIQRKRKPSFPKDLILRNSERLYQFLKEEGKHFERTPEEQAREFLIQMMVSVRELKEQEEKK